MARKPEVDRRQTDFFGAPAPTPAAPARRPASKSAPGPAPGRRPPPAGPDVASSDNAEVLAARLSPAELNELVAALPDESLAHLVIAAFRQLRRRLARGGGRGGKGRASALERSARQLIAELREGGGDDDDWDAG